MFINIIKNIFVPARVGAYQLIAQRTLGIAFSKTHVSATQMLTKGKRITIERYMTEPISNDATISYQERVGQAIKNIISHADRYDELRTSISGGLAIFKELTMPFANTEKITMVLPYELEPFLPFPVHQSIVDFIITKQQEQTVDIMAVALKKEYLAEHLAFFQQAGVQPSTVTIDIFDVYGLYATIPVYAALPAAACIDIGFSNTHISYIIDNQLRLVRTLPKGISYWAKMLAQKLQISTSDAASKIIRFGLIEPLEHDTYYTAIKEVVAQFFQEIRFTLESFSMQKQSSTPLHKILLLGEGAQIADIVSYAHTILEVPCELFDIHTLIVSGLLRIKKPNNITSEIITSCATAYTSTKMQAFNLKRAEFADLETGLFIKQFLVGCIFALLPIILLLGNTIWNTRTLRKTIVTAEQEILTTLKKLGLSQAKSVNTAVSQAEEKVAEEESIWFSFSRQKRLSFLQYLQTLSTYIDKKALGIKISKLSITKQEPSNITIDAEVKNFDAVKTLERELKRMGLFSYVPSIQQQKFSLQMELKKNGESAP